MNADRLPDPADAARRLERHLVRVQADTGMQERDVEYVIFMLEQGLIEVEDLDRDYNIRIHIYR